jgi:hypothetical protein
MLPEDAAPSGDTGTHAVTLQPCPQDWASFTEPETMLALVHERTSERKLRLFACACCRAVWHLIAHPHCRAAVCVAEQFADGQATVKQLESAEELAQDCRPVFGDANLAAAWSATRDAYEAAVQSSALAAEFLSHSVAEAAKANANAAVRAGATRDEQNAAWERYDTVVRTAFMAERARQADLLRELFPPPDAMAPAALELPAPALQLAEALYSGGDCAFALHDALLEAGQPELAEHFAAPVHPKGCWALDRILGRS